MLLTRAPSSRPSLPEAPVSTAGVRISAWHLGETNIQPLTVAALPSLPTVEPPELTGERGALLSPHRRPVPPPGSLRPGSARVQPQEGLCAPQPGLTWWKGCPHAVPILWQCAGCPPLSSFMCREARWGSWRSFLKDFGFCWLLLISRAHIHDEHLNHIIWFVSML